MTWLVDAFLGQLILSLNNRSDQLHMSANISGIEPDTPLVSVVVIFLNGEKFLRESIESVLAQTYSAWELLLVDDGSTDSSAAIACEYAQRMPTRIRYLQHADGKNHGMSASRNRGMDEARGEYIALLDADDVWGPEKLAEQIQIMAAHPSIGMVFGPSENWYSWDSKLPHRRPDKEDTLRVPADVVYQPPTLLTLNLKGKALKPCPSNALLRREAVHRVGGCEVQFRSLYEDQAFFAKIFLRYPVYLSSRCWIRYRRHAESCMAASRRSKQDQLLAKRRYLEWMETHLLDHNLVEDELWAVLQHHLLRHRRPFTYRLMRRLKKTLGRSGELVRSP
jgi:glycosyltransferase involved in cell wall biosynthesis